MRENAVVRFWCVAVCALLAAASGGCAGATFERIHLGQAPHAYRGVLPDASTRQTDAGLAYLQHSAAGTDTIVVLLSEQRRVVGKLYAHSRSGGGGWSGAARGPRYRLVGELDRAGYGVEQVSPVDALRLVASELATTPGEPLAVEAQQRVVAGLLRWLERWPGVEDYAIPEAQLATLRDVVSGGGVARLTIGTGGVLGFEYVVD